MFFTPTFTQCVWISRRNTNCSSRLGREIMATMTVMCVNFVDAGVAMVGQKS